MRQPQQRDGRRPKEAAAAADREEMLQERVSQSGFFVGRRPILTCLESLQTTADRGHPGTGDDDEDGQHQVNPRTVVEREALVAQGRARTGLE